MTIPNVGGRVDTGRTVHTYAPTSPGITRHRTTCGRFASGLVWWPGMPVTSDPPTFTTPPAITCPDCLAAPTT